MSNRKKLTGIRVTLTELSELACRLQERAEELDENALNAWSIHELKEQALMIQGAIVRAKLASLQEPEES